MKIEIIKLANTLKKKLGMHSTRGKDHEGYIDPEAIKEADRLIEVLCEDCVSSIGTFLINLNRIWKQMKDMEAGEKRAKLSKELFHQSHEIKDISSMCGYDLIAFFAESLRDYVDQTELSVNAQRIIIQAHIDAINVAHKQGIKENGGPAADELMKLVKVAIQKYS